MEKQCCVQPRSSLFQENTKTKNFYRFFDRFYIMDKAFRNLAGICPKAYVLESIRELTNKSSCLLSSSSHNLQQKALD